jgi:hypothetical protein
MQRKEAAPRAMGCAKERAIQRGIDKTGGIEEHRRLIDLWKLFNTRTSAGVGAIANPGGLEMPAHFNYSKKFGRSFALLQGIALTPRVL